MSSYLSIYVSTSLRLSISLQRRPNVNDAESHDRPTTIQGAPDARRRRRIRLEGRADSGGAAEGLVDIVQMLCATAADRPRNCACGGRACSDAVPTPRPCTSRDFSEPCLEHQKPHPIGALPRRYYPDPGQAESGPEPRMASPALDAT